MGSGGEWSDQDQDRVFFGREKFEGELGASSTDTIEHELLVLYVMRCEAYVWGVSYFLFPELPRLATRLTISA